MPASVYPEPAVNVVEAVSVSPMTTELELGVMEETDEVAPAVDELPNDVSAGATPLISYMDPEAVTVEPKLADIVSAPELAAAAYQM